MGSGESLEEYTAIVNFEQKIKQINNNHG